MNILFISYAAVSLRGGNIRAVAMVRALADAGHRVDLAAPAVELADHPDIRVLCCEKGRATCRHRIRIAALRAAGRTVYDAVHAVDDAVFFAARLCRWKKNPLVYDASRRFACGALNESGRLLKWFPKHFQRLENRVLRQAKLVFTHCGALAADLRAVHRELSAAQVEDFPAQTLYVSQDSGRVGSADLPGGSDVVVVCDLFPGAGAGLRNVLLAARKVVDAVPRAIFFFRGVQRQEAQKMADSLDIAENCTFLSPEEPEKFFVALEAAQAVLAVPPAGGRYVDSRVYTLLLGGVPVVAVQDPAYDEVLTEQTAIRVLPGSDAMAEGVLRVLREPLFSLAIALEGQRLVACHHAYSSFKHKVRMSYIELKK